MIKKITVGGYYDGRMVHVHRGMPVRFLPDWLLPYFPKLKAGQERTYLLVHAALRAESRRKKAKPRRSR
jgi:hypothetical protein